MLNILSFSTDTAPAEMSEQKHRPGLSSGHGIASSKMDFEAQRPVESRVAKPPSTSRFNNPRDRLGLGVDTILKMLKGSLPTTIAIAM
jgi:hypothetical protein